MNVHHPVAAPAPASEETGGSPAAVCHVVSHVHWDREWYRTFEAFRSRLVELAEHVCAELESDRMACFHFDGQTITVADVLEVRPDLAERLKGHVAAGRLAVGPWHVLADNQLVSGENMIRNLLAARRAAGSVGGLTGVGYSPDAFGHPADLPRILRGFGLDTALVWRGAPGELARFRWRSPDGSEVYAVNQGYHEAEVLWEDAPARFAAFLNRERGRLPEGPWLLLNGGDHLAPSGTTGRLAELREALRTGAAEPGTVPARPAGGPAGADRYAGGAAEPVPGGVRPDAVELRESTLEGFFTAARAADPEPPVVAGELRRPGGRLTFLLPGTLSARTYLKQANAEAQTLLERWAEPQAALSGHAADAGLRHAWDLLLQNAPHDSICGCSVDEVHGENTTRYDRVASAGEHVLARALRARGLDVRLYGDPCAGEAVLAVLNPHAGPVTQGVTAEVLTAPGRRPARLLDPDGAAVPFECVTLGAEKAFEADLDLLPDTRDVVRHRLAFVAGRVPPLGWAAYRVTLDADPDTAPDVASGHVPGAASDVPSGTASGAASATPGTEAVAPAVPVREEARAVRVGGLLLEVAGDASLTVTDGDRVHSGLGLLSDVGDRGDTYNHDPVDGPAITPRLTGSAVVRSAVRTRIELDATLDLPAGLTPDRESRSAGTVAVPVRITVTVWHGLPELHWEVSLDNRTGDHRLRMLFPAPDAPGEWLGDAHFSLVRRPVEPEFGPLPTEPAREAWHGVAPVQSFGAVGSGAGRVAVVAPGLPEMQGLPGGSGDVLAVTLLRAVGWLSRFDLRSRTAGAGPMLATPGAQCRGPQRFGLTVRLGGAGDLELAGLAARFRAPLRAVQARPGTAPAARLAGPSVEGARLSALKPAEDGDGYVLRVSNPASGPVTARIAFPAPVRVSEVRLDETPLDGAASVTRPEPAGAPGAGPEPAGTAGAVEMSGAAGTVCSLELPPYGLRSLRVRPADG